MDTKIDGMMDREMRFYETELDKIDGEGNKTVIAEHGQNLTIHNKIDGRGNHRLENFGNVEILGKVDGQGDRWFVNCRNVHIHGRKDGMGNIFFVNTPSTIDRKGGSGNIYWDVYEPHLMHGLSGIDKMEQHPNLSART